MRIGILVFPGVDEQDVVGPFAALRRAGGPADEIGLVDIDGASEVPTSGGLVLAPVSPLDDGPWDLLVVPGGGWQHGRGVAVEAERGRISEVLAERHAAGVPVAAVCTGALLLGVAGLVRGRPATTHASARSALVQHGARWRDERVVDDGDVLTCGGVTAGIDMGLHLVDRFWGRARAEHVARGLEHDWTPVVGAPAAPPRRVAQPPRPQAARGGAGGGGPQPPGPVAAPLRRTRL